MVRVMQTVLRPDTPDVTSMVKAIVDLGHNLGMQLVAEGVETEMEATILEGHGLRQSAGILLQPAADSGESCYLLERIVQ